MLKNVGIAAFVVLLFARGVSAAPQNCREGFFLELPDPEKTIRGVPSSATFLVSPEQRLRSGVFYAKVHGSVTAEAAIAGYDFVCEYDVGPSCPQLGQLVSRIKAFKPDVGTEYDEKLRSITLHGTTYRLDIRDGQGSRASFYSNGWSDDSVKKFVATARELLEACMPGDVAAFAKSRLHKHRPVRSE